MLIRLLFPHTANFVIIFDVEWNPSNDSQAQDRAYRLGQSSNVVVFRLVSVRAVFRSLSSFVPVVSFTFSWISEAPLRN